MTSKERIKNILARKNTDRIGLFEEFWTDTQAAWNGHFDNDGTIILPNHALDMEKGWAFNFIANVDFAPVQVGETDDTVILLDGNGATLRQHKHHVTTPEHVSFRCDNQDVWLDEYKSMLKLTENRIDWGGYDVKVRRSRAHDSFLMCSSWNVFQNIVNLCGHENLLMAMALTPKWVHDMVATYSELAINLHEELFAKCGLPDGIYLMDDLGYKHRMFMSADMFREFIKPAYVRICSFAKSLNLPVLFHSCGYVEPIVSDLIDAGIDCLTAMEVKAGMDVVRLFHSYGDRLSFMGGIDTRVLSSNDQPAIEAELQSKIPVLKTGGYILSSDHSIPGDVTYETYCFFAERGLELGRR